MANYRVAKRYAKGFMDFVDEQGLQETAVKEMENLVSLFKESRELKAFVKNPVIDHKKKIEILSNVLGNYSPATKKFLALLINNGRSESIQTVAESFIRLYQKKNGILKATLTSAQPMDDAQLNAIIQKAKSAYPNQNTIALETKIDPSLVGGFILRVEDKQYDASLKTRLNNLKKEFNTKHYISQL